MAKKTVKKKISKKIVNVETKVVHSEVKQFFHKKHSIKENVKTVFDLIRVGNCLMAAIAILIGFYLASGADYKLAAMAAISGFLICGAGQAINDFFDAKIDAKTSKERPIPSNRITAKKALCLSIGMFLVGGFVSSLINTTALQIAVIFAALLIVYPLFMNKIKYLGNFVVAAGTAVTFIFGAAANASIPQIIVYIFIISFLSNMGREITKDIQDLNKDKGEKRTLPMIIGTKLAKLFVAIYYILAIIGALTIIPMFKNFYLMTYYVPLVIVSSAIFIFSIYLLHKN
ncbi:MAG: geranylgeranylglycerol-phosphate geranylgeranyltransferase, partial [archaeon]